MEEGAKSGDSNGVVVKNRSSSGCLIVRKKSDGSSGSKPSLDFSKEKKRARLIGGDSGSSDEELEPPFLKRVSNGCDKGVVENSDVSGSERKTSKLGVFEFDEYDAPYNSDDEAIGKTFFGSKATSGTKGDIVYKRKHSYFDRGSDYVNKRFETKKLRDSSEEPIRVQGRNGVLKVMPSKKKKGSGLLKTFDHMKAETSSRDTEKKNELAHSPTYAEEKVHSKAGSSTRTVKNKLDLQKSSAKEIKSPNWESDNSDASPKLSKNKSKSKKTPAKKNSKALDWESDNSDTSLKLEGRTPVNLARSKEETTPPSGKILSNRSNVGKTKRGSGTEKQKLREQIKKMLMDAGWTIDYRPRRNRDYQDAVYVNPSGTAYWSIVKAYDAFQKQFDEEEDGFKHNGDFSSFSPISEDVISKLTRQTQKKMEKDMKRKQRDANWSKNVQGRSTKRPAKYKHDMTSKDSNKGKSWKVRAMKNDSSDSSSESRNEESYTSEDNLNGNPSMHGRKNRKLGRCTLVVRSSDKVQNSETDGYVPYTGKRTLLSWLIDSETVGLSEKVQYMNRRLTRVMLEGWITRGGIHCGCCSKILTVTKFEVHAGSKLRQPYQNIYLESGISLLQCQMDAWNKQEESKCSSFLSVHVDGDDPNDDTCGICGDGGDLICCDGCPSTFHQTCLGIEMLPTGDWHCPNCICKLCGMVGSSRSQGNEIADLVLPTCSLCERKYHQSCIQDVDALHIDSTCLSFCGKKCREIFEKLQKFIGTKHDLEGGFSWSLIHRTDIPDLDTSVRGLTQRVECNSKLAVALTVMDECFLPIVDRRSGINLIRNVLYNCGSNFSRLNYSGFYTAILERGDEIIAAASIRFHGTQLAEMPFIGTRHIYRRQGMCNRLFRAIELALCSFKVEKLIIPAISELMHTWTEVFGFAYLEESQKEELRSISMLVFPGIDMLRKLLLEDESNFRNVTISTGDKSKDLEGEPSLTADTMNKSSEDSGDTHGVGTDDNVVTSDSAPQSSKVTLNDATLSVAALDTHEVKVSLSTDEVMCTNSQSEEKVLVSVMGLKPIFSDEVNNAALGRRDNLIQESTDMDDANGISNNVASVEPVSHSVEFFSAQITTGKANGHEDDRVFVSPLHENDENLKHINSDFDCDISRCNETLVDSAIECAGPRVCEMKTASQLGNNIPESTNVREVKTGSHSDDDIVDYDSKPKYVSPCNKNQTVSKMVDTRAAGEPSVESETGSQLGKSVSESASDSETNVLEVHTKIQSVDEMEENASKPKCVSPCNKNEDAFKMEDTLAVDTSHKCAVSAVCEMGTECERAKNISESALDDFAENASKLRCISPCNQNQYASLAVDTSFEGVVQSSLEPETESLNDSVACAEPVPCFSGEIPTDNSTEAINEDKKTTPFF